MQTEWHHYNSPTNKRLVGAYGYVPDHSEDNLVHVYIRREGGFAVVFFVKALSHMSGPLPGITSISGAKQVAMRLIENHIRGQGSLKLINDAVTPNVAF